MPGLLEGFGYSFSALAAAHSLILDSVLGVPMGVFAGLLIGFIVFGVALQATGGGKFFLDLAFCLLGSTRGGPAKVAVIASALFGSISGSAISNVVTTGTVTIPAMKRMGFPAHYAGAIEACASTGGVLLPPVMGATAFIVSAFLGVSYAHVALAAAVPSILYYLGLLLQIDAYAAKMGLKGLPKNEIPAFWPTLKEGWIYVIALGVLIYFLFAQRLVGQAPFYGTAVLLTLSMIRKETRFGFKALTQFLETSGKSLAEMIAILAGVGMIMGGLTLTGVAHSFSRELVVLAGGNVPLMLVFGALASFVLGMGMTITPCYIFLAIVLAPALVTIGLNEMAVHLFVMYWGMLSSITPPVAVAAFPAATIANTSPMKVAFTATRLGGVIYILPFFFVFTPALILQGGLGEIVYAILSTTLGVLFIASALGGHFIGVGSLEIGRPAGYLARIALIGAGILLGLPGWDIMGLAIGAAVVLWVLLVKRRRSTLLHSDI